MYETMKNLEQPAIEPDQAMCRMIQAAPSQEDGMEVTVVEDLPIAPLGQVIQGTGWGERAVNLPPLWEGLYLRVEHDVGSPLRDFLQGLISRMGNTTQELPPALMAWMERQQRAMEEMGGALHNMEGGLRVHELDL